MQSRSETDNLTFALHTRTNLDDRLQLKPYLSEIKLANKRQLKAFNEHPMELID